MIRHTASRSASFLYILMVYLFALAVAAFVIRLLPGASTLLSVLLADAAATLAVWLAGVLTKNSSVYDPYWSVAPVPIALWWAWEAGTISAVSAVCLAVILLWAARLTANWARRWRGLGHQDWRYTMYRENQPRLWFVINLFGIHLMPTALVYAAMIPVFFTLNSLQPANALTAVGVAVCAGAVLLELAADLQMDAWKKGRTPESPCIAQGLWSLCRHPNYLGEILFWWGLWLAQESLRPAVWTVACPALITLLFACVSVPMMERHLLETRPEYAEVIRCTPALLPRPFAPGRRAAHRRQAQ